MASTFVQVTSGVSDEAHPELFNIEAMPSQSNVRKHGQLPEDQIRQFFREGFVVVENFFDKGDLEACKAAVSDLVDHLARKLLQAGKIKDTHSDCGFYKRLIRIEEDFPGANILLHKYGVLPQAFKSLWTNTKLLNVIEQLIGPDISGHPIWNLRTKTPQNEATTVPWHQDVGYLDNNSYTVLQPTAWIPLLDADDRNGCLEVMRKGHKTGKVGTHTCCYGNTWYVMLDEEEMKNKLDIDPEADRVVCPVPYGGMLLLNNLIPHRSLPNISDVTRWSLDLRWQNPSLPNGFYGLKSNVLMRTRDNPSLEVDWSTFVGVDRRKAYKELLGLEDQLPNAEEDDFDTTLQGPWMKKWEIVHVNDHVGKIRTNQGQMTWQGHKA